MYIQYTTIDNYITFKGVSANYSIFKEFFGEVCSGIIHKQTKNYSQKAQEKPAKFVGLQTWQFVANPTKN